MKQILIELGKHLLWGLLIILGGLFFYMVMVQEIGYLPYSDRPGRGWYDGLPFSWSQISYIGGFIGLIGIYIFAELVVVYILFRLFRLMGFNHMVYAVLGGLVIGFLTAYITMGMGWYIAIDGSSVIVGGLLGAFYGAVLFPNIFRPRNEKKIEAPQ